MLNAPGRLGAARPTLDLLLADNDAEAARLARELVVANETRRKISAQLIDDAVAQVHAVYGSTLPAGLVLGAEGWHPGVGGIVAGRLVERFARPVIVIAFEGGIGAGSARAPRGFGLYDAVAACAQDLEQFGGHDGAAGMKVRRERLESLRARFADACASGVRGTRAEGTAAIAVDAELYEQDLEGPLADHLESLEPTGQSHPEPLVMVRGARIGDARPVGIGHLRLRLGLGRFGFGAFVRDGAARRERGELVLRERQPTDLLGRLRADPFAGPGAVQLDLVAARPAD
jgi:single-stranded-DNA-specific exonuclease